MESRRGEVRVRWSDWELSLGGELGLARERRLGGELIQVRHKSLVGEMGLARERSLARGVHLDGRGS